VRPSRDRVPEEPVEASAVSFEPSFVTDPVVASPDRLVLVNPLEPVVPLGTARAPSDDGPEGAE